MSEYTITELNRKCQETGSIISTIKLKNEIHPEFISPLDNSTIKETVIPSMTKFEDFVREIEVNDDDIKNGRNTNSP